MPTKPMVLLVGGAGYIGAQMVKCVEQAGCVPVVLDNLATGHRNAVVDAEFILGDIHDTALLEKLFATYSFTAVMHFAAFIQVNESVRDPTKYYFNNVVGTLNLLKVMLHAGVKHFIFSSTAAVYGNPFYTPIDENHKLAPITPYGRSKYMVEQMLQDFAVSAGLKYMVLRYFNACGGHECHEPETHLIPLTLEVAQGQRAALTIYGTDYSTPDGTCVRDYVHVEDICDAHWLALQALWKGHGNSIYNVGTGQGYSVKQVVDIVRAVTGSNIPTIIAQRREGDPAVLVADASAIVRDLGWQPRYSTLPMIIEEISGGLKIHINTRQHSSS